MSRRFEMLVVDLDGTLLRSDGTVSDADRHALFDAADAGMEVILATGRSARECSRIVEEIGFAGPMITAGGSVLCHSQSGETIRRDSLCPAVTKVVIEHLVENNHKALVLKDAHVTGYDYLAIGDAAFHPASAWWFDAMDVRVREHDLGEEHPDPDDSLRVGAVASERDLAPIAARLAGELSDRCRIQHWSAVTATEATESEIHLLEVFGPRVDKWMMVETLCREMSISSAHVAAIGDGLNDVELIEGAGLGIAMANADDRVRVVADHVTGHHNHDGVAQAVRALLSGAW